MAGIAAMTDLADVLTRDVLEQPLVPIAGS